MTEQGPVLRMEGITKRYGGVRALDDAHLHVRAGRIHAILGENGAGKSTLIKVLSGVVTPDAGAIFIDDRPVTFPTPAAANEAGVACIFQELSLIPDLTAADNILIGNPPRRMGLIDRRRQRRLAEEALVRAGGSDIHPLALVRDLPLSRRQIVEIAKALVRNPRILILDEATSALTAADVETVFELLKRLRSEGLALLYISHRMHEIAELADECTVFRNGRNVATFAAASRTDREIVEMMIGREFKSQFPPRPAVGKRETQPILDVRDLIWRPRLNQVSLTVRAGEVVGLGGLDGQGQTELLLALFGVLRGLKGDIRIAGKAIEIASPGAASSEGIGMALIPADRKTEGLLLPMTVRENLSLSALGRFSPFGVVNRESERRSVAEMIALLNIKPDGAEVPVATLSGGNQQKVVIAKWLMLRPRIILLNDPTRGIDVGTKQEIYALLRRLADGGAAILFYSTDYDELVGLCDRVLVMYEGAVQRELEGDTLTERALVGSALNMRWAADGDGSGASAPT